MSYAKIWAEAWYDANACGFSEEECDRMVVLRISEMEDKAIAETQGVEQ